MLSFGCFDEANLIKDIIIIGIDLLYVVPTPDPSLLFVGRGGERNWGY
jgi:hypothetical protein